jgi:O-antigen/teichoic acid export membrane protein
MTNLLVNLGTTILLVGVFGFGMQGALISIGLGYLAVVLLVLPRILLVGRMRVRWDIAKSMLAFGVPQVGSLISFWVLQVSDRELLLHFKGPDVTAGYSVAYTLGGVLAMLVINPFQLAWPTTMYTIARRKDYGQVFAQVFRYLGYVLLLSAFALSLFSTLLLDVLFPRSYSSAALVIPIVALSIAFYGAYQLFITGVSIRRLTWLATLYMALAALVNLGLNLVLIPRFSSMGAAASTLIAYVLLAVITYVINQRIYPIPFEVGRFMAVALVGAAIFAACYAATQSLGTWSRWPLSIGGFLLYAGLIGMLTWRGLRTMRAHPAAGA